MVQSLFQKVFQVTTVANDFASIVMEGNFPFLGALSTNIEATYNRIGQDVGKLLRYATDFDPTLAQ